MLSSEFTNRVGAPALSQPLKALAGAAAAALSGPPNDEDDTIEIVFPAPVFLGDQNFPTFEKHGMLVWTG